MTEFEGNVADIVHSVRIQRKNPTIDDVLEHYIINAPKTVYKIHTHYDEEYDLPF